MIRNMRDLAIFVLTVYVFAIMLWVRLSPEAVGEWMAQMDIGYDLLWSSSDSYALSEYLIDYTCNGENT